MRSEFQRAWVLQQEFLQALDSNENRAVRLFTKNFSKSFDRVKHNLLMAKLTQSPLNPCIVNWHVSLLSDRKQRVVFIPRPQTSSTFLRICADPRSADFCIVLVRFLIPSCSKWSASFFDTEPMHLQPLAPLLSMISRSFESLLPGLGTFHTFQFLSAELLLLLLYIIIIIIIIIIIYYHYY